jgi:ammonia channel protein AmtB
MSTHLNRLYLPCLYYSRLKKVDYSRLKKWLILLYITTVIYSEYGYQLKFQKKERKWIRVVDNANSVGAEKNNSEDENFATTTKQKIINLFNTRHHFNIHFMQTAIF